METAPEERRLLRVLHVVECYEGGVGRAVRNLVQATPGIEHHLLFHEEAGEGLDVEGFRSARRLPASQWARVREVRRAVARTRPDVVHAHSSWAGVYARVVRAGRPVVYQPHGFAHVQPRRSPLSRFVFGLAERLLARRTSAFVAVSPAEARDARALGRAQVLTVHNLPTVPVAPQRAGGPGAGPVTVVMLGRLCTEKDPGFFADVAAALRDAQVAARLVWLGDGEAGFRATLEAAGVDVTGWLSPVEVTERLDAADLYLHSSSTEGFPLAVLDAAARDVPVLVRDIAAFRETPLPRVGSAGEAATEIRRFLEDASARAAAQSATRQVLRDASPEAVAEELATVYAAVLGPSRGTASLG